MARIDTGADYVIRGVANPENPNDAANKQYVDSSAGGNTTYDLTSTAIEGGASVNLDGSDGSEDTVGLVGAGGLSITHSGNIITFTGGGGDSDVFRMDTPPESATAGDLWFRTTDGLFFLLNGAMSWIHIGDAINRLTGIFGFNDFTAEPTNFTDINGGDFNYQVFQYEIDGGTF